MEKIQVKSTQADMCLKYLRKELFIYLYAFLKAFKTKKVSVQKYLDESYLLHHEPLFLCVFYTRIKNI